MSVLVVVFVVVVVDGDDDLVPGDERGCCLVGDREDGALEG